MGRIERRRTRRVKKKGKEGCRKRGKKEGKEKI